MRARPQRSTRTDNLFPYTTLFRSRSVGGTTRKIPIPSGNPPGRRDTLPKPGPVANQKDQFSPYLRDGRRSEEHTSELQSLMRISYAVFCWKKKKTQNSIYICKTTTCKITNLTAHKMVVSDYI